MLVLRDISLSYFEWKFGIRSHKINTGTLKRFILDFIIIKFNNQLIIYQFRANFNLPFNMKRDKPKLLQKTICCQSIIFYRLIFIEGQIDFTVFSCKRWPVLKIKRSGFTAGIKLEYSGSIFWFDF